MAGTSMGQGGYGKERHIQHSRSGSRAVPSCFLRILLVIGNNSADPADIGVMKMFRLNLQVVLKIEIPQATAAFCRPESRVAMGSPVLMARSR